MEWEKISFDTLDSTHLFAKTNRHTFSRGKITTIVAKEQTKGKGRLERPWLSPKGNLYATFFFCWMGVSQDFSFLSLLMAHSVTSLLQKHSLHPTIKWPNDVQVGGKKIAGILVEIFFEKEVEVLVSVGLNLHLSQEEAALIDQPVTSLFLETGHTWDADALLSQLQEQFAQDLFLFQTKGWGHFTTNGARQSERDAPSPARCSESPTR